jgi:plastocyanin
MFKRLIPVLGFIMLAGMTLPGHSLADSRTRLSYSGPVQLPTSGALFGVHLELDQHNGTDRRTAMTDFEALVGRSMAIDREYYFWNDDFPTADDEWSRDQGRTLYLSWSAHPNDGSGCRKWADIAAGLYDADIDAQAVKIIAFGAPTLFAFHHEPTTGNIDPCGTPAEYIAAWNHVHDRFVADAVTNVTWAWTMTAWSFTQGNAGSYYPGDTTVDVIASDGYNWAGCTFHPGPWRDPIQVFQAFHAFGALHAKPMVIAEYGTGEDPAVPGRKGQWFTDFADLMKTWTDVKGAAYFNSGNGSCDRYVDTSQTSLDAFTVNGADTYFNPPTPTKSVTVADFSFTPKTVAIPQGTGVAWSFNGPSDHTATDNTGMGLFDSGTHAAGSTYIYYFIAAGAYRYMCTIHPSMTGNVNVPILASPTSGTQTTVFTITWSANYAPTGYVFDVQIRRPGSTLWVDWNTDQTVNSATFVADAGAGTYSFRARYRNTTNGASSNYSKSKSITVH